MYAGYLIRCGQTQSNGQQSQIDPSNYTRVDYGLIGGLGLDIPIKQFLAFSLEARENLGFGTITKGQAHDFEQPKNQSIALMFGVRYKL
jgi:hypothetical protein